MIRRPALPNSGGDPSPVIFSVHLYRAMLLAYPVQFRREYGEPMLQVFRDSCRRAARQGGMNGLLRMWFWTIIDYCKTVVEETILGGVQMRRDKFVKLSGWALVVGAVFFLVGLLASSRPEYDVYNAKSLAIDRFANQVGLPIGAVGLLLISLGMVGMLVRYGSQAGAFGQFCLGFGAFFGMVSAAGALGSTMVESEAWWLMFFLGLILQNLFLALFGLVCLRRKLLPRWNGLPLLAGIGLPLAAIADTTLSLEWLSSLGNLILVVMAVCLLLLGYLVLRDAQPAGAMQGS
jgi:hypothetical protein